MTAFAGEAAAGHGEVTRSAGRIAGHGLIDHDAVQEGGVAVALGVAGRQVTVVQGDGVEALDAHALREVRDQLRVGNGDIRRRVNGGRAEAVGGIGAAVYDDGTAAAVCTDRRTGAAGGFHRQIIGIGGAAAGGHDAAGAVSAGGDDRITDGQRGAVAGRAVLPAVAAVAEYAVGAVSV